MPRPRPRVVEGRSRLGRLVPDLRGSGLSVRLFAAQALVVFAGALTLLLTTVLIAPGLFRTHVRRALGTVPAGLLAHLDRALDTALLTTLAAAVLVALATALAVTWAVARRVGRPVAATAAAASRIADGRYHIRVPPSRLGAEFTVLDNAFNRMAATLEQTERRRRELLADLAHELRTPVASLDSFLEGVQDGVLPANDATWCTMREQTGRLRRLIEDVNELSRAEERHLAEPLRPVAVDDLIEQAVRAWAARFADKGVTLSQQQRAPDVVRVLGDPDRLREIFDNLLGNALRHTPPGGRVSVSVETSGGYPWDRSSGTPVTTEGVVLVRVADTGEGIPAQHLPHLFDRFYRVDPARSRANGGSGIGLSIARALALAHGGDLGAASDGPGCGATFTLTLPASTRRMMIRTG